MMVEHKLILDKMLLCLLDLFDLLSLWMASVHPANGI